MTNAPPATSRLPASHKDARSFLLIVAGFVVVPIVGYFWSQNWFFAVSMLPLSALAIGLAVVAALQRCWLATVLGVLGPIGSLVLVRYDLAHLESQTVRSG